MDVRTTCASKLSKSRERLGLEQIGLWHRHCTASIRKVATVQNRYNLIDRSSEDVLNYCEEHGIGFIPWYPLAAGRLAKNGSILDAIAKSHGATPSQIALAMGA